MVVYSNAALFGAEAIGMLVTIYFGESVIANEVLCATKGHGMGWGAVALGFGMSFGMAIMMVGFISARLNPAMALAELILGSINGSQFGCIIAGDFLGAFMGAVLVWIHHLPHFKCCPEPPAASSQSVLLRSRDALALNALDIASYNARESDIAARKKGIMKMTDVFGDITYYLKRESETEPQLHPGLADIALGHDHIMGRQGDKLIRRHSIQVCDAHRRLEDVDLEGFAKLMVGEKTRRSMAGNMVGSSSSNGLNERAEDIGNGDVMDESKREQEKLAKAAIVADQNAKLSIFSTRPAIYAPMFNLLTEIMCTTALIYGALMISERANMLLGPQSQLYGALVGLILGFFIYLCVLALGGPTGIAANPARDFAPRMAHFVLPIHGKGPSEFYYAWIPIVGPFIGGCLAAGLYSATQLLNKSNV